MSDQIYEKLRIMKLGGCATPKKANATVFLVVGFFWLYVVHKLVFNQTVFPTKLPQFIFQHYILCFTP